MAFADRLRVLRKQAGLSQGQLAMKVGLHRFTISKLERGEREPSWETVRQLSRALGVTCLAFDEDACPEQTS